MTLRATSASPAGPWRKAAGREPFSAFPGTYYSATASPGEVVRSANAYLQFFSAASLVGGAVERTLSIARTNDPDATWSVDAAPILPPREQVENSSLFFQIRTKTWFMFTNHVGIAPDRSEFTDAIWVYWSADLNHWNPEHKALVLDGASSTWSRTIIGLPSVVRASDDELAMFYDGKRGGAGQTELEKHMDRDIGLALIRLPISVPSGEPPTAPSDGAPATR